MLSLLRLSLSTQSNLLILCLLFLPATASPSFTQWINEALPHKGQTLGDELQCYALPYGGIGFGWHILTYYTIIMLAAGRSPWLWKKNKHWKFDAFLSTTGLIWTVGATIFTMIRCRNRWQFVVMAFWKMMMSMTLSAIATHSAVIVRRKIALGHFVKDRQSAQEEVGLQSLNGVNLPGIGGQTILVPANVGW